jgi:hypothetical protein
VEAYRRLALAIVIQALKDAQKPGNEKVIAWLLKEGFSFLEVCGLPISEDKWRAFVMAGGYKKLAKTGKSYGE